MIQPNPGEASQPWRSQPPRVALSQTEARDAVPEWSRGRWLRLERSDLAMETLGTRTVSVCSGIFAELCHRAFPVFHLLSSLVFGVFFGRFMIPIESPKRIRAQ